MVNSEVYMTFWKLMQYRSVKPVKQFGFTLIEMMVVVVIIGILASIAYPSYQNYVLRSGRTDARDALLNIAQQLERHLVHHVLDGLFRRHLAEMEAAPGQHTPGRRTAPQQALAGRRQARAATALAADAAAHQRLFGEVVEFVDGVPGGLVAEPGGLGGAGDRALFGNVLQQRDALWAAGDVLGENGG